MNQHVFNKSKQSGFSLVGLMIASLIGIFITGAAIQMYLGGSQTYQARQAISAASENSRFALDDISRTIVMAGRGMARDNDNDYKRINGGQDAVFGDVAATQIVDGGVNGSDEILFKVAQGKDCMGNDVVDIADPVNWIDVNGDGTATLVGIVTSIRYYIAVDGNGISNLMCQVGGGIAQPLVSGIEMIKFLYGVDTTGNNAANYYLPANQLTAVQWGDVVSVRIGVISSSAEFTIPSTRRLSGAPAAIKILTGTYTPADNSRSYYASTATVLLRNLSYQ